MKFNKFLSTALALSLVAATPVFAEELTEDSVLLDSTASTEEFSDANLDEQVYQSPDMGVGGEDMPTVEEEVKEEVSTEVPSSAFPDVVGEWYEVFVEKVVAKGYFTGYSETNTTFRPGDNMSRAEFAVNMLNLRDAQVAPWEAGQAYWYENYFIAGQEMGILPSSFTLENMGEDITREEVACFMIQALGQGNFAAVDGNVADIADYADINSEYADFVTQAFEAKLLTGDSSGFRPKDTMTRYEVAIAVGNADSYYFSAEEEVPEEVAPLVGNELSESYKAILDSLRNPESLAIPTVVSDEDDMWEFVFTPTWNLTSDQLEGYAIVCPTISATPYCVAVMKPAEGELDAVLAGVDTMIASWSEPVGGMMPYPGLVAAAETAIVETIADDIVIFVMIDEGGQELADALQEALTLG
ncbi:MAG: S-layer homology domain-containing protein [Eubacteriales bacterium]